MRTFLVIVLAGVAFVAGNSALAGRDASQLMQLENQTKSMLAAQAKQSEQGLAGPTGAKGQVGPGGQPRIRVRNPAFHP